MLFQTHNIIVIKLTAKQTKIIEQKQISVDFKKIFNFSHNRIKKSTFLVDFLFFNVFMLIDYFRLRPCLRVREFFEGSNLFVPNQLQVVQFVLPKCCLCVPKLGSGLY